MTITIEQANVFAQITVAGAADWTDSSGGTSSFISDLSSNNNVFIKATVSDAISESNTYRIRLRTFGWSVVVADGSSIDAIKFGIRIKKTSGTGATSINPTNIRIYNASAPDSHGYTTSNNFRFSGVANSFTTEELIEFNDSTSSNTTYIIGNDGIQSDRIRSAGFTLEFDITAATSLADTIIEIDEVFIELTHTDPVVIAPQTTKLTAKFDESVDPRFTTLSTRDIRNQKTDYTYISNNLGNGHKITHWEFKKDDETKASIAIQTNNAGVVGEVIDFINIQNATKTNLGIILQRQFNWLVRFKADNGIFTDWETIDLSGDLRVLGTRHTNNIIKTVKNNKLTFEDNKKLKVRYIKKGAIIERNDNPNRPAKSKKFKNNYTVRYTKNGAIIE